MSDYQGHLHRRSDGRQEVDDTTEGNRLYGCQADDWCILRDGHDGACDEQRESIDFEVPA